MIKTFSKLGIKGQFFNLIKVIYENPTANVIFKEDNDFPLRLGTRQGSCSLYFYSIMF